MNLRQGPKAATALALGVLILAAGCAPVRDRQGHILDETLVAGIQPGVDNRDSVSQTLGRPTFTGQGDDNVWYYVSRNTRNMAFHLPRPSDQLVLRIRFDEAGNVAAVDRTGLEYAANIDPASERTPTLGRERSFFEELFGNVGAAVGGQSRGTADNPQ
ncbi:MAG: outer membrane protein assembly factor BamE [Allosphingosinicella sp.]|uniref:outer membrane protein assembly factor BamE n=1 Tax=Allosphingosinicella sp. TaxID=2823234 RepID=UPI00395BEA9E